MTQNLGTFPGRLLLVGCGNMAGAMLDCWLATGLDPAAVTIVDPAATPRAGVAHYASLTAWSEQGGNADWVLLGMKPQQLAEVASDLAPLLNGATRLLSIMAGVSAAQLAEQFPGAGAIVRILPNLPARIGQGISAAAGPGLTDADRNHVDALLAALGERLWLDDDSQMDLVTAFTGSGPAFVFRLIEAYAAAGERLGLGTEAARSLAMATFGGAAALLATSGQSPAELIAQVASKGGTTQAGLDILDSDGQLAALFTQMLRAARDRGRELAELAKG